MSEKHSPGPWRWDRMGEQLIDGNGRPMGRRLSEADGTLAAAAPELLAMVKRYRDHIDIHGDSDGEGDASELIRRIEEGK